MLALILVVNFLPAAATCLEIVYQAGCRLQPVPGATQRLLAGAAALREPQGTKNTSRRAHYRNPVMRDSLSTDLSELSRFYPFTQLPEQAPLVFAFG